MTNSRNKHNISLLMLTGDAPPVVDVVFYQSGIDGWYFIRTSPMDSMDSTVCYPVTQTRGELLHIAATVQLPEEH